MTGANTVVGRGLVRACPPPPGCHRAGMQYRWRDLAFDVDDAVDDRSMIVLALPSKGADLAWSLVVSFDQAPHGVAGYVDEVLREQATSLSGFRVASRSSGTAGPLKVILVDDLIATGGTAEGAVKLLKQQGADVLAACFIIDLPELGGAEKIRKLGVPVRTLVAFAGH